VDVDTVFEAASVSKTVFAYAVLKLTERGGIGLDTPLTKYAAEPFLDGDTRSGSSPRGMSCLTRAAFRTGGPTRNP
jgi:CubicO group peptidase (beta-lactamase class C family)